MSVVSIESGRGDGFTASVTSAGHLQTEVEEVQRIVEPVTTRPQFMTVDTTTPMATSGSSSEIVGAMTNRRWIEIQNLGDFPVHIVLADSGTSATVAHRRLDPGDVYSWRDGVSYEGAVQAIAVGGSSNLVVTQFVAS